MSLSKLVTAHSLTLTWLQRSTQYTFRVKSTDANLNQAVSPESTFTTTSRGSTALALPLFSSESSSLNGANGEDQMVGMAIANTGSQLATLTFTAIDESGNLIAGPGIVNPSQRTLEPGKQMGLLDRIVFGKGVAADKKGWIKLESTSSDVHGFFLDFDSSLMDGASFANVPLNNCVFTEIEPAGVTRINASNTSSEDASVDLSLMTADGRVRRSYSTVIKGNGSFVADLYRDVFPGIAPDPADYVLVSSTQGLQAFEFMRKSDGDASVLVGQDSTAGAPTLYSPQYAVGGPWRTHLSILNLDSQPGTVTLQLVGNDGAPIGTPRIVSIAANGKLHIDDPEFFTSLQPGITISGYVKIESDGIRLTGSTVFGGSPEKSFSSALPLVDSLQYSVLYSHVASNDLYFMGIALANPNALDANLSMEVVSADGAVIDRIVERLPAMQKRARLLTEYFPSLVGKDLVSGFVRIVSDQPIASFSLFGTNDLSVLSAIPPQ